MMLLVWLVPALFFLALALSGVYVYTRLLRLWGKTPRWPGRIVAAVVLVGIVGSIAATATSASPVAGEIYVVAGHLLTFHLFLLMTLLVTHALQKLGPLPPRPVAVTSLMIAAAFTAYGAIHASDFSVKRSMIELAGLEKPVNLMLISDVHVGHHRNGAYLKRIVDETNRANVDLVLITGDLLDSAAAFKPGMLDSLKDLQAPAYYVIGNHEIDVDADRATALIATLGVRVLHNEQVQTHGLNLLGLDYMKADEETFDMHPSTKTETIRSTLEGMHLPRAIPTVVMHHSPVGVQYVEKVGAALMLAGHTHGGQMFPGTAFASLTFPYNKGLYRYRSTQVFVTVGAGTFLQKSRIGTGNEIDLITLAPEGTVDNVASTHSSAPESDRAM
ncbi:TPA: metallophosphoesterase [Stenotrophomonas maltophilia]|uniref:metallophosphoesterase n=1 Tax=Stenotrophomonas maltophilia TaxID=40324 RepID=UPI0015DE13FB|nr:metallophosphoesterase [Stenotrophomonas maltophilia]MBA0228787.1 hypothetical protein [Stenotrophomonas maltophilia]